MRWQKAGITEADAVRITCKCIEQMVDDSETAGEGYRPCGNKKTFLETLMFEPKNGRWYIWFDRPLSDGTWTSGIAYEKKNPEIVRF